MWIANVVEQVFGEILWEVLRGVIYRNNITNKTKNTTHRMEIDGERNVM